MKRLKEGAPSLPFPIMTILAGGTAGAASVLGNTPVDVVKTQMQGLDAMKYGGAWGCIKHVAKTEGFVGFYKGVGPRMARVVMDVAITFTLFENIKRILNHYWP